MCAHSSILVEGNKTKKLVLSKKNCVLTFERILSFKNGFVPLNSVVFRANPNEEIREFCAKYPFIYAGVIMAAINGGIIYISKPMSVCKEKGVKSVLGNEAKIKLYENITQMLTDADRKTNFEFAELINLHKIENRFEILRIQKNYKEMKAKEYKTAFRKLSLSEKIKVIFSR